MRPSTDALPTLADFPCTSHDKLRYGDTDRLGHVNNAVFSTYLETGRVDLLHNQQKPMAAEGTAFVIANLNLDYLAEINWPGTVEIGTAVRKIGTSSMTLDQAVFQAGQCVATGSSVLVQMNNRTRKSQALSDETRLALEQFKVAK